jgi:hypothetical protein
MVIFHSYVSLPEGDLIRLQISTFMKTALQAYLQEKQKNKMMPCLTLLSALGCDIVPYLPQSSQ